MLKRNIWKRGIAAVLIAALLGTVPAYADAGTGVKGKAATEGSLTRAEKSEAADSRKTADTQPEKTEKAEKIEKTATAASLPMPTLAHAALIDGYYMEIAASEGTFPKDTKVNIARLSGEQEKEVSEKIAKKMKKENWEELYDIVSFDISFVRDGKELEPAKPGVKVKITLAEEFLEGIGREDLRKAEAAAPSAENENEDEAAGEEKEDGTQLINDLAGTSREPRKTLSIHNKKEEEADTAETQEKAAEESPLEVLVFHMDDDKPEKVASSVDGSTVSYSADSFSVYSIVVKKQASVFGSYTYEVSGNHATITKYSGKTATVEVPSVIKSYEVTEIGAGAFADHTEIKKLTLPDGIVTIGKNAFSGCTNMKLSALPAELNKVGERAFFDCKAMNITALPKRLATIGGAAFGNCLSITSLKIPNSYKGTLMDVFYAGDKYHWEGFETGLKKLMFEAGRQEIPDRFAAFCGTLTTVVLPSGLRKIGEFAFADNEDLTMDTLPDSVTEIGYRAFAWCYKLKLKKLPKNLKTLGEGAFLDCVRMTENASITVPAKLDTMIHWFNGWPGSSYGLPEGQGTRYDTYNYWLYRHSEGKARPGILSSAYWGSEYEDTVKEIVFEKGRTSIPISMCEGAIASQFPETVVGDVDSFQWVRRIVLPDTVDEIQGRAFYNLSRLENIVIPSSVTFIASDALGGTTEEAGFTIWGDLGSYAEEFAGDNGYTFKYRTTSLAFAHSQYAVAPKKTVTLDLIAKPAYSQEKTYTWKSSNTKVAKVNSRGVVTGVAAGKVTITATAMDGTKASCTVVVNNKKRGWYKDSKGTYYYNPSTGALTKGEATIDGIPCYFDPKTGIGLNGWRTISGKKYWYENGERQGTRKDKKGVMGDGTVRGREIYDPGSRAWYWLDAVYNGAKAENKEVWMPYIYQNETANSGGKWVRYNATGAMIKGWYTNGSKKYYYHKTTGAMLKGKWTIDGKLYNFDARTGVLK